MFDRSTYTVQLHLNNKLISFSNPRKRFRLRQIRVSLYFFLFLDLLALPPPPDSLLPSTLSRMLIHFQTLL
jgi:hypothetical protein